MIIYVLGQCNDPNMVRVEKLSDQMNKEKCGLTLSLIFKKSADWNTYIDQICAVYGFYQKNNLQLLSFTSEGQMIGDINALDAFIQVQTSDCNGMKFKLPELCSVDFKNVDVNILVKTDEKVKENDFKSNLETLLLERRANLKQPAQKFNQSINLDGEIILVKKTTDVINRMFKENIGLQNDIYNLCETNESIEQNSKDIHSKKLKNQISQEFRSKNKSKRETRKSVKEIPENVQNKKDVPNLENVETDAVSSLEANEDDTLESKEFGFEIVDQMQKGFLQSKNFG